MDSTISSACCANLLHLPDIVLQRALRDAPWSTRAICSKARAAVDGGRTHLQLRLLTTPANLSALLTRLPQLTALDCRQCFAKLPQRVQSARAGAPSALADLSFLSLPLTSRLTHLDLQRCPRLVDLRPLAACQALRALWLTDNPHVIDISPLGHITTLDTLHLDGCQLADLRPLAACVNLRRLSMPRCRALVDVSPVAELSALTHLDLSGCWEVHDLSPLAAGCLQLAHLDLAGCTALVDIAPLAACQQLQFLTVSGCGSVIDLTPLSLCAALQSLDASNCCNMQQLSGTPLLRTVCLSGCANLVQLTSMPGCDALSLKGCHQLMDLSPLTLCTSLTTLDLSGCSAVRDVAPLSACMRLVRLQLDDCCCVCDIAPLASLVSLSYLDLSATKVTELTPLTSCTALATLLYRHKNGAETFDLSQIRGCPSLTSLTASGRSVRGFDALATCSNLRFLDLNGSSQLQDVSHFSGLTQLVSLDISRTGVLDVSPLSSCVSLEHLAVRYCDWVDGLPDLIACPRLTKVTLATVMWGGIDEELLQQVYDIESAHKQARQQEI